MLTLQQYRSLASTLQVVLLLLLPLPYPRLHCATTQVPLLLLLSSC